MATNEILQFAETDTGTNLLTQAEYLADAQRPIGNQPGVARSKLVNKALRQSSLIAAAVAQFIADNQANNVVDTATPTDIADWIEAAVRSIGIPTAVAGGTADAITADFTPNVALTNGTTVIVRADAANATTTPTFAPDGLTAKTIVKGNNLALVAGDVAGTGHWLEMNFDTVLDKWVLQNPARGVAVVSNSAWNKIVNGNFAINQRAYVSGAATTAGQYTLDRWKVTSTGGITFSTSNNKTTVTIPSGQTLQQIVEGLSLQSGTYVLSWEGTAQGRINDGSYGASGAVTAVITGGSNTTIEFNAGTVTNVQLEPGTIATQFEQTSYQEMLDRCRYFYRRYGPDRIFNGGVASDGSSTRLLIEFDSIMRTSPTAASSGSNALTSNDNSTSATSTGVSFTASDNNSARINISHTALGAYRPAFATINSGHWVEFSSEL